MKTDRAILGVVGLLGACLAQSSAWGGLVVTVRSDKETYVEREPISLNVSFRNDGAETLHIMSSEALGQNMQYLHYRVVEPGGVVVRRQHHFMTMVRIINPEYSGEPLAPGEELEVNLYPAISGSLPGDPPRSGFTFDKSGTYGLSVVYSPPTYGKLSRPSDGSNAQSNELHILIQEASPAESEILDAYWSDKSVCSIAGDDEYYAYIDVARIRTVLATHGKERLSDYLRFNLARGLLTLSSTDAEGYELLEGLKTRGFRTNEVYSLLAVAYAGRGDKERALTLLYDLIVQKPQLLSNVNFMRRVILVDTGSHEKLYEWEVDCSNGRRNRFAGVKIREDVLRVRQQQ